MQFLNYLVRLKYLQPFLKNRFNCLNISLWFFVKLQTFMVMKMENNEKKSWKATHKTKRDIEIICITKEIEAEWMSFEWNLLKGCKKYFTKVNRENVRVKLCQILLRMRKGEQITSLNMCKCFLLCSISNIAIHCMYLVYNSKHTTCNILYIYHKTI